MSQETFIEDHEEEIWVCGGKFYHSLANAKRFGPAKSYETDEDGNYIKVKSGRGYKLVVKEQYPIYRVKLNWEQVA